MKFEKIMEAFKGPGIDILNKKQQEIKDKYLKPIIDSCLKAAEIVKNKDEEYNFIDNWNVTEWFREVTEDAFSYDINVELYVEEFKDKIQFKLEINVADEYYTRAGIQLLDSDHDIETITTNDLYKLLIKIPAVLDRELEWWTQYFLGNENYSFNNNLLRKY